MRFALAYFARVVFAGGFTFAAGGHLFGDGGYAVMMAVRRAACFRLRGVRAVFRGERGGGAERNQRADRQKRPQ